MADIKEQSQITLESELNHWWIKSRGLYLLDALKNTPRDATILEIGCGTGQNLYILKAAGFSNLYGVDVAQTERNENSISISKVVPSISVDVLILMDVLEHVENDRNELIKWTEKLKIGGTIFITVPAHQILWSNHDIFLGHYRRYNLEKLISLANSCNLSLIKTRYFFSWLFPILFLYRKVFNVSRKGSDLVTIPLLLNHFLIKLGLIEFKVSLPIPFGTSLCGIFYKDT